MMNSMLDYICNHGISSNRLSFSLWSN